MNDAYEAAVWMADEMLAMDEDDVVAVSDFEAYFVFDKDGVTYRATIREERKP